MVATLVFCKHYKVSACVALVGLFMQILVGNIHLTSEYRLQNLSAQAVGFFGVTFGFSLFDFLFCGAVYLIDVIEKFLCTEHIPVVSDGQSGHSVGYSLVNQRFH